MGRDYSTLLGKGKQSQDKRKGRLFVEKHPFSPISPLLFSGLVPENSPLDSLPFVAFPQLFGQGFNLG